MAACKACNTAKKYLLTTEWEEYLVRLAEGAAETPPPSRRERDPG